MFRRQNLVAAFFEHTLGEATHTGFIFDDQHDGSALGRIAVSIFSGVVLRRRCFRMARQVDLEDSAHAGRALDTYIAAGLLDDAVNARKPESRAFADRLGREERLEDLSARLLVEAAAGVGEDNLHDASAQTRQADGERAAVGHRLQSVSGEVPENLPQLRRIEAREQRFAGQVFDERVAPVGFVAVAQQRDDFAQRLAQIRDA